VGLKVVVMVVVQFKLRVSKEFPLKEASEVRLSVRLLQFALDSLQVFFQPSLALFLVLMLLC
jgi:hypothetical protein